MPALNTTPLFWVQHGDDICAVSSDVRIFLACGTTAFIYPFIRLISFHSISSHLLRPTLNDNADHIQHLLHDPLVREIQSLQTADFQTTINQEMLYQLVASLELKEARIVLQHLIGVRSIRSMRSSFSKWSNVTKEKNSRLMDSDKVSVMKWDCKRCNRTDILLLWWLLFATSTQCISFRVICWRNEIYLFW